MHVKKRMPLPDRMFDIANKLLLGVALVLVLYPLTYILSASFSDPYALLEGKVWLLPLNTTFEGYIWVFRDNMIWIGYRNTIFYTILGTSINLTLTLTAAFALSRKELYGRNIFMFIITFTMFLNGGMIPLYLMIKQLGMLNTMWALMIPSAVSVMNVIIARTFFVSTIPEEMYEASMLDGCNITKFFFHIALPLSKPVIAVLALYYGVAHWNRYFDALIYISDKQLYPLQLVLRAILLQAKFQGDEIVSIQDQQLIGETLKYSLIIVASLPMLMLYPMLQKYFVKGVMIGAIKG